MTSAALPADPALGEALANYPADRLRLVLAAGVAGALAGAVLTLLLLVIPDWWIAPLAALAMAATGLGLGWLVLHLWNREIVLYERGFSYQEGSRTVPFYYAEVSALRLQAERLRYFGGRLRRDSCRITLVTEKGDRIVITDLLYRRAPELGTRLTEQVNAVLGPRLKARYNAGDALTFAPGLRISRDGFSADARQLPWDGYGGYRLGGGKLHILAADEAVWAAFALREIDNVTLLLQLLRSQAA